MINSYEQPQNKDRDLVVYILLRTDLPSMNWGKSCAQVHHAGVQMAEHCAKSSLYLDYIHDGMKNNADHFNTTLVLGATKKDITDLIDIFSRDTLECGKVIDPTYPFIVDKEISDLIQVNDVVRFKENISDTKSLFVR
jgi:hypothetical protein